MHATTWFCSVLAAAILGASLTFGFSAQDPAPKPPIAVLDPVVYSDELRHPIFFAVLEGLYRDGVSNEVVDKLLEIDPVTKYPANFIWACPICLPVIDALDVYRARPMFRGRKLATDTFGAGLAAEVREVLLHGDMAARQDALKILVEGWIRVWFEARRPTPEERARFQSLMEDGRKQGMAYLKAYRALGGSYGLMDECPSCEAGNAAGKR